MAQFDWARYQATEDHCWREVWLEEAHAGRIWLPHDIRDTWAETLCMILYALRDTSEIRLFVDCEGGDAASFDPCRELYWRWENRGEPDPTSSRSPYARKLSGLATISMVTGSAGSVGLSYSVCATNRLALPNAKFMVHGETLRTGARHESGAYLEDHYVADWLARFTKRSYEDWLDLVDDGAHHEFGVAEALDWGVIDEVLEAV